MAIETQAIQGRWEEIEIPIQVNTATAGITVVDRMNLDLEMAPIRCGTAIRGMVLVRTTVDQVHHLIWRLSSESG